MKFAVKFVLVWGFLIAASLAAWALLFWALGSMTGDLG